MRVYPKMKWTEIDVQILRSLFPNSDRTTIQHNFSGRTWKSIELKAERLGIKRPNKEERKPNWKGDKATPNVARERARRKFPVKKGLELHHIDGNPLNNSPENIKVVTRKEHMVLDGRLEKRTSEGKFSGGI